MNNIHDSMQSMLNNKIFNIFDGYHNIEKQYPEFILHTVSINKELHTGHDIFHLTIEINGSHDAIYGIRAFIKALRHTAKIESRITQSIKHKIII